MTTFNQIDPRKAPGIDGLPGSFFKEHWQTLGEDVLKMCHEILNNTNNVFSLNETLLVMIPKVENPCDMTNYRPISLCRFVYKMVSKVLANRLKEVIPLCISLNQSAFVPGRMIHGNVLVAHELMHHLLNSRNGSSKGCVVKLDMSKAYDRVEWGFLENVLLKFGFFNEWVNKIMCCVRTVRYRVKCNTQLTNTIILERGLRQGDPLSPYLFLFCMEVFSRMLTDAQKNLRIRGIHRLNLDKSMVCFGQKTAISKRTMMNRWLNMKVVDSLDGYLGLPIPIGNKRLNAFKNMVNCITKRINSWSKRFLSYGGKEIFIKSVLQAIPAYGGLGFRDLRLFNVALLGRQVWRLLTYKDTLCYKVLSSKYFPNGDVFHPIKVNRPSFTWQSISKAASTLYEGFGWCVGNGRNIDLWKDHWGFEGLSGSAIRLDRNMVHEKRVSDLLNANQDDWKEHRILELFGDSLKDQICKIPIIHDGQVDHRIWFHNSCGFFSSKSAYSWLILKQIGFGPHRFFWRIIWKLKILPKIRIFGWRLGHDILPTYDKIANFRSELNSFCPRCGNDKETLIHALKDCPKARAVLEYGGFNNRLLEGVFVNCIDWVEKVARVLDKIAISNFLTVLWNIWNSKNYRIFQGAEMEAKVIWEKASALSHEFRIYNLMEVPMIPKSRMVANWKKPVFGVYKINIDASIKDKDVSFGLVARDCDGFVLGGRMGLWHKNMDVLWEEMTALKESINFACTNNWDKVQIETDCASLVNRFKKRKEDVTNLGYCLRALFEQTNQFVSFDLIWALRSYNSVADQLCKLARDNCCNKEFNMDYPLEIHNSILKDAIK
ncbi:reverse transcriptase [Gossypium australe]|uniref:Reverse transcriptase n=1 Tax=Gossypium australe TaxID=47621 RepID=A0A5B6VK62_9ROSI|nr:reverse transcriptase [Gossypium australe]